MIYSETFRIDKSEFIKYETKDPSFSVIDRVTFFSKSISVDGIFSGELISKYKDRLELVYDTGEYVLKVKELDVYLGIDSAAKTVLNKYGDLNAALLLKPSMRIKELVLIPQCP